MPIRIRGRAGRQRHFLKEWRKHRGLSQEKLADRLNMSAASLSRIENYKQPYSQRAGAAAQPSWQPAEPPIPWLAPPAPMPNLIPPTTRCWYVGGALTCRQM